MGALRAAARFGLLGRSLGHSWSPSIHARLGSIPYTLFEVEPQEVSGFIREGDWSGINVTIPYKRDAFELADERSEGAMRLGVANTLVRRGDGSIYADNTDLMGFGWMLDSFCRRVFDSSAERALVDAKGKPLPYTRVEVQKIPIRLEMLRSGERHIETGPRWLR